MLYSDISKIIPLPFGCARRRANFIDWYSLDFEGNKICRIKDQDMIESLEIEFESELKDVTKINCIELPVFISKMVDIEVFCKIHDGYISEYYQVLEYECTYFVHEFDIGNHFDYWFDSFFEDVIQDKLLRNG